jgi:hypothetical protein
MRVCHLSKNLSRAGRALKAHAIMRSIAERTLLARTAPAQRNCRLTRQIPLLAVSICQQNVAFHPQRTIGANCNLYCFFRHRRYSLSCKGCGQNSKVPTVSQSLIERTQANPARSLAILKNVILSEVVRGTLRTTQSQDLWYLLSSPVPIAKLVKTGSHNVDFHLIHIAPTPILTRLYRTHNRVLCCMKMFGRMFVQRRVTTAHMAAEQAHPQMHPLTVNLQTLLAPLRRRLHLPNLVHMSTLHSSHLPSLRFYAPPGQDKVAPLLFIGAIGQDRR